MNEGSVELKLQSVFDNLDPQIKPNLRSLTIMYDGAMDDPNYGHKHKPRQIELKSTGHKKTPVQMINIKSSELKTKEVHKVSTIRATNLVALVGRADVTNEQIIEISKNVDTSLVRELLPKIHLMDTKSIINFGLDMETSSRTTMDNLLNINLKDNTNINELMIKISDEIKLSYKSRGILDSIFGFDDRKSLSEIIRNIEKIQKQIESDIPTIHSLIEKVENLFLETRNCVDTLNAYIVALKIAIKQFSNEDISWADDITQQMIKSNIGLIEKRILAFQSTKMTLTTDPIVIFNMREYYISLISSYQDNIVNLIHDWKNNCSLQIQNNKRNIKRDSASIIKAIDTTLGEK